ncbi:chemokine (C-X-C motif) ligand 18b [Centroberyx gerrardi]
MAFSPKTSSLLLGFVIAVCIQLYEAQFVPGTRCSCEQTVNYTRGPFSDFRVIENAQGCDKVEVIVTKKHPDNSTEDVCLNPTARLGKAFLICWRKINRDNGQKVICVKRSNKNGEKR